MIVNSADRQETGATSLLTARNGLSVFVAPTPLIGRERDIERVVALFRESGAQLVTLTGAGGVGKTRLAFEIAELLRPSYADGVVLVSLAAIREPHLVLPTIALAVGASESADRTPVQQIQAALRHASMVLVLDNVEQVVSAAPSIGEILAACPGVALLATSRGPLHISGEYEHHLLPLQVGTERQLTHAQLSALPSVRLFTERARATGRAIELTEPNTRLIAEICRRVDGLPLAIELAAARSRMLAPAALLARLDRRLPLLTGGSRNHPERQQTLRNAIAWSYDLLQPDERQVFRGLAVFVDGFTLAAAEQVVAAVVSDPPELLDVLAALVDKGLLTVVDDPAHPSDGETRFLMLETIREFALELLVEHEEAAAAMDAHAAYILAVAEAAETTFLRGDDIPWIPLLAVEQGNIRAAINRAIEQRDAELGLRLVAAVHWFWFARGQFHEGRSWLGRLLTAEWTRETKTTSRSRALFAAGMQAHYQGDTAHVGDYLQECESLSRAIGDDSSLARSLLLRGVAAEDGGDFRRAIPLLNEALTLFRKLNDRLWTAQTLVHLGVVAFGAGDLKGATASCQDGIAVYHTIGAKLGAAVGIAGALDTLSLIALAEGDFSRALADQQRSLTMRVDLGNDQGIASSLAGFASIAARISQPAVSAYLFAGADALRETIGVVLAYPERTVYERAIEFARSRLPADVFADRWDAGRSATVEDLVVAATGLRSSEPLPVSAEAIPQLTPREIEILRAIAGGASDREIGNQLFISHRTVMRHVTNIYGKLGVNTRSAATAYAYRHGLFGDGSERG